MRQKSIFLIFPGVKCIVFRGMQQMSHGHRMFFIIICLYVYNGSGRASEKLVDYPGQNIKVEFFFRILIVLSIG